MSNQMNPTHTYASSGTYGVYFSTYDSLQSLCDTAYQLITVQCGSGCNLTLTIDTLINPTCYGWCNGMTSVNVQGGTYPFTYMWSNGQTTSAAYQLCAGTYSVTVMDANGCIDSTNVVITDPSPLVSTASIMHESYCGANDGSVIVMATGGIPVYLYSINGGIYQTNGVFQGLSAGVYTVSTMDANGCIMTQVYTITCISGCQANFTPIWDTTLCTVYFQNNSAGASSYLWDFGDGNTSNQINPQYTWSTSGVYNVVLYAYDSLQNLCDSAYQLITVQCGGFCNASFWTIDSLSNPCVVSFGAQFNSAVVGPGYSWSWDFGDGTTGSGDLINHTYTNNGIYNVVLYVYNNGILCDASSQLVGVQTCTGVGLAGDIATIELTLSQNMNIELMFTNVIGDVVDFQSYSNLVAGEHKLQFYNDLPSGIYLLHMITPYGTKTKKLIVQR